MTISSTEEPEPVEAEPKGDVDPDNAESAALASEQDQGAAIPCFFTKEYSDSLPEEACDIVISSYHDRTYITGRLIKYSNGRSCITSGWGSYAKMNSLATGSDYALQFHKCAAAGDQLCLLIFNLA
ncbi:hypothetical protein ACP70R_001126 [Stipagrostis hirtigluma subsp. patula]